MIPIRHQLRRRPLYPRFDIKAGAAIHASNNLLKDQARNTTYSYPTGVYTKDYEDGRQSYWPDSVAASIGSWAKDTATFVIVCRPAFTFDAGSRAFYALYMSNGGNEVTIGYSAFAGVRSWIATIRGGFGTTVTLSSTGSITSNAQIQKPIVIIVRYSVSGTKQLWVNGSLVATSSTSTSSMTSQTFNLGGTTSNYWKGGISAFLRIDRYITDGELALLSANPNLIYSQKSIFLPMYVASGGTVYTVDWTDGIYLDDGTQKGLDKTILDSLLFDGAPSFLNEKVLFDSMLMDESPSFLNEKTLFDALLLPDVQIKLLEKFIIDGLFLSDSILTEIGANVTELLLSDNLLLSDDYTKQLDKVVIDFIFMDDEQRTLFLREMLTLDNLYLGDSSLQTIYSAVIAALVYARLGVNNYLGIMASVDKNYLGINTGIISTTVQ